MKIQIGEVYMDATTKELAIHPNKTRRYLLPCIREYGEVFTRKINDVFKVAVGTGDLIVDNAGLKHEKHLFILLDSKYANKFFLEFMSWIKDQPMYEDDYVYGNIQKSTFHMVVLRFPEKYFQSLESFKDGKYSQMFDKETISSFFKNHPGVQQILIKDHNYRVTFTQEVNDWLNNYEERHMIKPEEWTGELDFPPTEETEKFNTNFKKTN